jgi:cytoskeletal protein CcmA (bactofilin family)
MNIGRAAVIRGDVTSSEDLRIDGRVRGRIIVRGATLVLGVESRLDADIRGTRVRIHGTVRGTVTATERIELSPTARVTGDLSAEHVIIEEGARFNGRIDMAHRTIAAKVAQYRLQAR